MKPPASTFGTLLAGTGIILGTSPHLVAGEIGPMASYAPPAPVSDCDACNAAGWYGGISALYLKSEFGDVGDIGNDLEGDWDFGARGTLGFERPDGLFYELNGMWYNGDYDDLDDNDSDFTYDSEIQAWYVEGLIGDNLHCGEACLDISFGLRYANFKLEDSENEIVPQNPGSREDSSYDCETETWEFEGIGPVIRIDGTRSLTSQVTLYGGLSQAILFGENKLHILDGQKNYDGDGDFDGFTGTPTSEKQDTLAFVTELEGGLQFDLNIAQLQGAHIRLGAEAQYWSIDGLDFGFIGGVLGAGFNF